jgi:hypothetical protein
VTESKQVASGKTVLLVGVEIVAIVVLFSAIMHGIFGLSLMFDALLKLALIAVGISAGIIFRPARNMRGAVTLFLLILLGCLSTFIFARSLQTAGRISHSGTWLMTVGSLCFMCIMAVAIWRKGWSD